MFIALYVHFGQKFHSTALQWMGCHTHAEAILYECPLVTPVPYAGGAPVENQFGAQGM